MVGKEDLRLGKGHRFPKLSSGASCPEGAGGVVSVAIGKPAIWAAGCTLVVDWASREGGGNEVVKDISSDQYQLRKERFEWARGYERVRACASGFDAGCDRARRV